MTTYGKPFKPGDPITGRTWEEFLARKPVGFKYAPDQARDYHGRFSDGGGSVSGETQAGLDGALKLAWKQPSSDTIHSLGQPDTAGETLKRANVLRVGAALTKSAGRNPALREQLKAAGMRTIQAGYPFNEAPGVSHYMVDRLGYEDGTPRESLDPVEVGGRAVAAELQDTWAHSASDSDSLSWGLQFAVADKLGIDKAPSQELLKNERIDLDYGQAVGLSSMEHERPFLEQAERIAASPAVKAYVDKVYSDTQKQLRDAGIKQVTLYRGMTFSTDGSGIEPNDPWHIDQIENRDITLNPLSSWATDTVVAEDFGRAADAVNSGHNPVGYVLTSTLPASRIFALPTTGPGCLREKEVIVAGGPVKAEVWNTNYDPVLKKSFKYSDAEERDERGRWTSGNAEETDLPEGELKVEDHIGDMNPQSIKKLGELVDQYGVKIGQLEDEIDKRISPEAIEHARNWYPAAHALAQKIAKGSDGKVSMEQAAAALAAMSGRCKWEQANGEGETKYVASMAKFIGEGKADGLSSKDAVLAWKAEYKATNDVMMMTKPGEPAGAAIMNQFAIKGMDIMTGRKTIDAALPENKQRSFYDDIVEPGETNEVTVDTHMVKVLENVYGVSKYSADAFWSLDRQLVKDDMAVHGAGYIAIAQAIRNIADERDVPPDVIQAAYWEQVQNEEHILPPGSDWPSGQPALIPKEKAA